MSYDKGREWNERDEAFLRDNWGKLPAPTIGEILFGSPALKNAVIGKAHRMGLGPGYVRELSTNKHAVRNREYKAREKAKDQRRFLELNGVPMPASKTYSAQPAVPRVAPPPFRRQPLPPQVRHVAEAMPPLLSNLPCRWPEGDPKALNFCFCDKPAVLGKPYCPKHVKQAYRPRMVA